MSVEAITAVKWIDCPTPSVKLVLFILANYADEAGSCYPSEGHIGKICGLSARQVRRCIKTLEGMNILTVQARAGTSNRYYLTPVTHDRTTPDTRGRGGRTPMSPNTKDKQKRRGSLNAIAG